MQKKILLVNVALKRYSSTVSTNLHIYQTEQNTIALLRIKISPFALLQKRRLDQVSNSGSDTSGGGSALGGSAVSLSGSRGGGAGIASLGAAAVLDGEGSSGGDSVSTRAVSESGRRWAVSGEVGLLGSNSRVRPRVSTRKNSESKGVHLQSCVERSLRRGYRTLYRQSLVSADSSAYAECASCRKTRTSSLPCTFHLVVG